MKRSKLRKFLAKSATKLLLYSTLTVIIFLLIFNLSQILQPLELAIYDFNFLLRPTEATDERIVVVEWSESSIKSLEETIISDDTLARVLQKIKQQQPRVIGLDIYRDIPVSSPNLRDEQNIQANKLLTELFNTTNNLIGIEKVVEPIVNPSQILAQKAQTAAVDLPIDIDRLIRRTYIYPQLDEQGLSAGLPYLGVRLGYEYLAVENFLAERVEHNSLRIFKDQTEIILRPLKSFVGAFADEQYSFNILVNWRKGKPAFRSVSVVEVLDNQVPQNFFADKIVLIGNVSTSSADRHSTALDRQNQSITYGVYIVAQVTSSIINAALEERELINPAPQLMVLILILIVSGVNVYLINQNQELRTIKLYFLTLIYTCCLSLLLFCCNFIAFSLGYWLPITQALGCIWGLYFVVNYYFYRQREQQRVWLLEAFVADFNHNLGNRLSSITSSNNRIKLVAKELTNNFSSDLELETTLLTNVKDSKRLELLTRRANNIDKQISKIDKYRQRIKTFIKFSYLNPTKVKENTSVNSFISELVKRFVAENEYEYQVCVQQFLDPQLQNAKIDRAAIEIVVENLLDNAFYSVSPLLKTNDSPQYLPQVKIKTKLVDNQIYLIVEDNGTGIKEEYLDKIFEPFVSLRLGQGIGLFLIKKIAQIYQGSIQVESKWGKGSKFIFIFPSRK